MVIGMCIFDTWPVSSQALTIGSCSQAKCEQGCQTAGLVSFSGVEKPEHIVVYDRLDHVVRVCELALVEQASFMKLTDGCRAFHCWLRRR